MRRKMKSLLLGVFVITIAACQGDCDPGPPPPDGFRIHTQIERWVNFAPLIYPHYDVGVFGRWGFDVIEPGAPPNTGPTEFSDNSGARAYVDVSHARAPALWTLGELNGPCAGKFDFDILHKGQEYKLICREIIGGFGTFPFAAFPSSILLSNIPAEMKVAGDGIDTTYGMPVVEYYNDSGALVGTSSATQVAADGKSISGPTPDLSSCYTGEYTLMVNNRAADGSLVQAGGARLRIGNDYVQSCVDQDGDGYCVGNDCNDYDPSIYPWAPTYCSSGEDRDCNGQDDYQQCYGGGCHGCEISPVY